jgi:hypothetical protein
MTFDKMTDAELDAAIAEASKTFTSAMLEKQFRGLQKPQSERPSTSLVADLLKRHPQSTATFIGALTLIVGYQIMRLFQ